MKRFGRQLARLSSAGIQHMVVESNRHAHDKEWALKQRRQVKVKLSGNKLADRQKVSGRIKGIDKRLSQWMDEHLGKGAGQVTRWSGWDMRLQPRIPLQDQILGRGTQNLIHRFAVPEIPGSAPAGASAPAAEGAASFGQEAAAALVEAAPVLAPALLVVIPLLLASEEDIIPAFTPPPEQSEAIPQLTSTIAQEGKKRRLPQFSAQPATESNMESAGELEAPGGVPGIAPGAGLSTDATDAEGPDVALAGTPDTELGGAFSKALGQLMSLLDDDDEVPMLQQGFSGPTISG
jgi:hypothetical protein